MQGCLFEGAVKQSMYGMDDEVPVPRNKSSISVEDSPSTGKLGGNTRPIAVEGTSTSPDHFRVTSEGEQEIERHLQRIDDT